ncbi:glycoside hydrolase family 5 protein [Dethiothermospora halolimnae]|uniref:glycoside hydrolase family 5 protein n=1 Tax=Dethiothermospora halolimnae TaxID=3114390 RepID=UPI003CCB8EC3
MKRLIKNTLLLIVIFIFFSGCSNSFKYNAQKDSIKDSNSSVIDAPIDPWEYQKLLGKGVDVDWSKTNKGRKYYDSKTVKDFKKEGVSHVRIRIADEASEKLLKGLDKQIEDSLEAGIIPIIAYQANEFKNDPTEKNIKKVIKWWDTVASRYKNKSHLLTFDLLIEATDALNKKPEKLNEIYERLVKEIRKTNPTRIVFISPRLRSDAAYLKELKIPTAHNDYLMAEWHFYASGPSRTNDRKLWTTGTDKEKKLITNKINIALDWQNKMKIPTWVGAWMPGNYNDGNDYNIKEQTIFAKYMTSKLSEADIPFAVNSDTKYYDRKTNTWIENMQPVFKAIFNEKK